MSLSLKSILLFVLVLCYSCSISQKLNLNNTLWQFRKAGDSEWMAAAVPGTVHTDLMNNKKIEDPYYRTNEKDIQWIGLADWEYKTVLNVDDKLLNNQNIELVFEGLDTYADVFVNNKQILTADNMFCSWKKEVKSNLVKGSNELRIYFHSPINKVMPAYNKLPYTVPVSNNDQSDVRVSVFSRKAGYHFGWDWGPRLVTSGIWRPVYLLAWNNARIEDAFIKQKELNKDKALLEAQLEVSSTNEAVKTIEVFVDDSATPLVIRDVLLAKGLTSVTLPFTLIMPELWYPNGLGKQKLYNFKVVVKDGSTVIADKSVRRGLRNVEVVQESNEKGRSFYFKVNGIPVFMKGANYIPQDNFLPRVTQQRYEHVIETAVKSNMNMLRVWGGGIYENEAFYNLCDERGILVWQDFMFACALYPPDDDLKRNIYKEAVENVKRLRNHPSIAMWCGNNEIVQFFNEKFWGQTKTNWNVKDSISVFNTYADIFHNILPSAVKGYDDEKFYWSSSPNGDNYSMKFTADGKRGDMHYWGIWHGKQPFEKYNEVIPSFMSEYGFQSFPEIESVKKFALPQDYDISSDVMKAHQRSTIGNGTIAQYMKDRYNVPQDFANFLYVGQVLQGEGIKMAIEAQRRAMPYCMGSLYWQIDDCWPVASWSSMDYYGRWKALQYMVKKAYQPLLLSTVKVQDSLNIYIVSDELKKVAATLRVQLIDFSGKIISDVFEPVTISGNSSNVYHTQGVKEILKGANPKWSFVLATLTTGKKQLGRNVFYFELPVDLALAKPKIRYALTRSNDTYSLKLTSDVLAKNVKICVGEENIVFSDNYFDLLPSDSRVVTFKSGKEVTLKDIKLISLVDTY